MVGLKVYKIKDKETYERLHSMLSGWCFFRQENDVYFVKAPLNNTIKGLIEMEMISEINE